MSLVLLNVDIPPGLFAFSRVIPKFKKFTHFFMREKILNFDQNAVHRINTEALVAGKDVPYRLLGSSYSYMIGYFLVISSLFG